MDRGGGKPSVTVRQAGDRALLVEYGEMTFDLTLNFFVLAMDTALRERPIEGIIEPAPGFRSMLISYDPLILSSTDLIDYLRGSTKGCRLSGKSRSQAA